MPDLTATLKRRMSAAQQASELEVGESAYEKLFDGNSQPKAAPAAEIRDIPMDKLTPFFTADIGFKPYPPDKLKAFAEQLATDGLFVRIIVRPVPYSDTYEILAGHNRVAAAKLNGWSTIPAEIVGADDAKAVTIATATNLLQRQDLSVIERGKAYKALLEAKNRNGQHDAYEGESTFGEVRQRYNARTIVAEFFGVTEYEIRKAVKLTCLIPPLVEVLEERPKDLPLACAEQIAEYDAASQEAFAEICSIEGDRLDMAVMRHIARKYPPPTADRQAVFVACREARAAAEQRKAAPPKKITFERKVFQPYLEKLGGDEALEALILELLKEYDASHRQEQHTPHPDTLKTRR